LVKIYLKLDSLTLAIPMSHNQTYTIFHLKQKMSDENHQKYILFIYFLIINSILL